jgi:type VI secretion system protein ImpG
MPTTDVRIPDALYYTVRSLPRLQTAKERRFGTQSNYAGSELYLSLYDPGELDDADKIKELSVRATVSNRHLAEQLPTGATGADFLLVDDMSQQLQCIAGPTPPRDSIIHAQRTHREVTHPGPIMWRLINLLSLSHLGLTDRSDEDRAGGVRELLGLFADLSDTMTEPQVRSVVSVASRQVVRRLRQPNGFNAARGVEITVTFDEKGYEGSGVMIVGAALDRFFAEYTSINSFTQTVIATTQRGIIMRWPPRSGLGGLL